MSLIKFVSNATTAVLVLCAIVVTGLTVRREVNIAAPRDEPVEAWSELAAEGHRKGPANAAVTIVEFADLQCPACAAFHRGVIIPILEQYPKDVALVYRHWPLEYHEHARPAAFASECAAEQGHFFEFVTAVFEKRDSLGTKSFVDFASQAGVPSLDSFQQCLRDTTRFEPVVSRDAAAALEIGGTGTPTVVINGVRLAGVPSFSELERMVHEGTSP